MSYTAAAQERPGDAQAHPIAHADAIQWQVAAENPGGHPSVITDGALLAAVAPLLPDDASAAG